MFETALSVSQYVLLQYIQLTESKHTSFLSKLGIYLQMNILYEL